MNSAKGALLAVCAFGLVMAVITVPLITYQSQPATSVYAPRSSTELLGVWSTRTLTEDNRHGAYSGSIKFGPDYYQVTNDLVAQPIRLDQVQYKLDGNHISLWIGNNRGTPTMVRMLSPDHATIEFPSREKSVLYMYRASR